MVPILYHSLQKNVKMYRGGYLCSLPFLTCALLFLYLVPVVFAWSSLHGTPLHIFGECFFYMYIYLVVLDCVPFLQCGSLFRRLSHVSPLLGFSLFSVYLLLVLALLYVSSSTTVCSVIYTKAFVFMQYMQNCHVLAH